jgi:3' terminal RNA ribose 2'-O-methyltransferase Hen1
MLLTIATTHHPATDLGFLLMKHPDRVHETDLGFGKAVVFYPQASPERCEAALALDIDPVGLVRGRGEAEGLSDQYVNDRPYAATSFLSVALNRAFRTAMAGTSRDRPELAAADMPLEIVVTPLPAQGGERLVQALFEPLGWRVAVERLEGPTGPSRYVTLRLAGQLRLADALTHLYVLIPVLDNDKHYWVGEDEVEKLLAKGGTWLASHPQKELIARRYLKNRRVLARAALARLAPETAEEVEEAPAERVAPEEALETPLRLNDQRLDAVVAALEAADAKTVADLGCGEGKLLARLLRVRRFTRLIGLDASTRSLERARARLKLDLAGGPTAERVQLLHGALTYRDARWQDADAAVLVEVIEHLDAERLPALAQVVFGAARPKTVIVTTPNLEHNALFPTLANGAFRHPDHRFEWTRGEFAAWANETAAQHGYTFTLSGIGPDHETHGPPTQMAVFTRT